MKTKKRWILACVCCIASLPLFVSGIGRGKQVTYCDSSTLLGLKGFTVGVLLDGHEILGLNSILQTKVELEFRKAGLRVLARAEESDEPYVGNFIVKLSVTERPDFELYIVTYSVRMYQKVALTRNSSVWTWAATWPSNKAMNGNLLIPPDMHFSCSEPVLENVIKREVTNEVEKFLNDYLAANPKERAEEEPNKPIHFTPIEEKDNK